MISKLRNILSESKVPKSLITELEQKPLEYQEAFLNAIEAILQDEILSLHAFMEARDRLKKKGVLN